MKAFILFSSLVLSQVIGGLVKREGGMETTAGGHGGMDHGDMGHGDMETTTGGHGSHGAMNSMEPKCCKEKKVGEVLYKLSKEVADDDLKKYNCLSGCIYKADMGHGHGEEGPSYCFANGDLPVVCVDNFHWCYEGKCGPAAWPHIYKSCAGHHQSPIDIDIPAGTSPVSMPLAFKDYDKVRATRLESTVPDDLGIQGKKGSRLNGHVGNNGHTAVLSVTGDEHGILSGGPLTADYRMLQLHFHWGSNDSLGSEHTIMGTSFPMEMHIVHIKVDTSIEEAFAQPDGLAVVGQMFEIDSADNPVLAPLIDSLVHIKNYDETFDMTASPLKVADLLPSNTPYANYAGSLTTPTCDEAVNWLLFTEPIKISAEQLAMFRTLGDSHGEDIVDNFRPPQPLNGRVVSFYE